MYGNRAPIEPSFVPATKNEKPALRSLSIGSSELSLCVSSFAASTGVVAAFVGRGASCGYLLRSSTSSVRVDVMETSEYLLSCAFGASWICSNADSNVKPTLDHEEN